MHGDTIPADGRLLASAPQQTAEAALTGESCLVSKDRCHPTRGSGDRYNMIFSRTAAIYGHGKAVVPAAGMGIAGAVKPLYG